MSNYSHVLTDIIFADFLCSCVPNLNVNDLKKEAYEMRSRFESSNRSNRVGYQSKVIDKDLDFSPNLNQLNQIVKDFSQDIVNSKNLNITIKESVWWLNINPSYAYNVLHTHGRTDLIAIYYISGLENCGELNVLRNDGSSYTGIYNNTREISMKTELNIQPDIGRLYLLPGHLWHYVSANESLEERISISFNININQ